MKRSLDPSKFLHPDETAAVGAAVAVAEKNAAAEIKFVICRHCWTDIRDKAVKVFRKLGLFRTSRRNCVLILLVTTNREFVIYGDQDINARVGQDYWDAEKEKMAQAFARDEFGAGIAEAIISIGAKLAIFYPPANDMKNEIGNEAAYEE